MNPDASRSQVTLRSADPFASPRVSTNLLGSASERRRAGLCLRRLRRIFKRFPASYGFVELLPGLKVQPCPQSFIMGYLFVCMANAQKLFHQCFINGRPVSSPACTSLPIWPCAKVEDLSRAATSALSAVQRRSCQTQCELHGSARCLAAVQHCKAWRQCLGPAAQQPLHLPVQEVLCKHQLTVATVVLVFMQGLNQLITPIERQAALFTTNAYHHNGACGVGKVLDADLKVKGFQGLRVCDGSAIPDIIPNAGPVSSIYMLAEFLAEQLAADSSAG